VNPGRYRLDLRPRAARQLGGPPRGLPHAAAAAVLEFVLGPLLDNPRRVGKPLRGQFAGQHSARCGPGHRIRYVVDDDTATVIVLDVSRRADAYRPQ
jgi:mRNA-degrading endonuclease RelE of RelBE toxin-antitoxin system